ncbi:MULTISPECIES: hypothetical protein [Pseudomonas]|uniref:Uncharacterized protein n=1 Tax=Pseudomonas juntendi TaxID=2666183 RepID=A0A7W2LKQ5_9PSED|nr:MULTISPECIES: hypothetical protein [Pseudomonas]MBA6142637.1 hypothetical protein [Pseudomonas juntendi]MCL8328152.1 hypothetical protein [Pseudomonas juntendi]NPA17819.1 hypothetical protein [Gammaproteobacteria bacterium]
MSMIAAEVLIAQHVTAVAPTGLFAKVAISSTQFAEYIQAIDKLITLKSDAA